MIYILVSKCIYLYPYFFLIICPLFAIVKVWIEIKEVTVIHFQNIATLELWLHGARREDLSSKKQRHII